MNEKIGNSKWWANQNYFDKLFRHPQKQRIDGLEYENVVDENYEEMPDLRETRRQDLLNRVEASEDVVALAGVEFDEQNFKFDRLIPLVEDWKNSVDKLYSIVEALRNESFVEYYDVFSKMIVRMAHEASRKSGDFLQAVKAVEKEL